jgi:hypothetical protein
VVVDVLVDVEVVEANEGPFVEVIEQCCSFPCLRVYCGKVTSLFWPSVCDYVQLTGSIDAAMHVPSWRIGFDDRQIVGDKIKKIPGVVLSVLPSTRWTSLHEEERIAFRDVTGSLVDLQRQRLELLYDRFGPMMPKKRSSYATKLVWSIWSLLSATSADRQSWECRCSN